MFKRFLFTNIVDVDLSIFCSDDGDDDDKFPPKRL